MQRAFVLRFPEWPTGKGLIQCPYLQNGVRGLQKRTSERLERRLQAHETRLSAPGHLWALLVNRWVLERIDKLSGA